jgi:hypothetical protein
VSCDIAATCLCRGDLPADGVLEATIFAAFQAHITAVHGNASAFAIGETICIDQSVVGASILVPVKSASDAAQVVLPPPLGDGGSGTCVPNQAYTVLLDDGGRPLACNDGIESQLSLDTPKSIAALMASDCTAALAKDDSRWSGSSCAPGGCETSALPTDAWAGALVCSIAILFFSYRRGRSRSSAARRAGTG